MRAVNLVPAEARAGRVSGGKSGGAVYGVLGVLALLLVGASLLAMSKKSEAEANQELAAVQQSTQAYNSAASQFSSFEAAASQATSRISTVRGLAEARFDWAGAMREMSRLIPETTQVFSLSASVKDGAGSSVGGGSQLRGAIQAPAITLTGCSKSQVEVANLITRLQAMRRATNVALESSTQAEGESAGGCSFENAFDFVLVVFFSAGNAKASEDASPGPGTGTAIATESATPAATTPAATTPAATTPGATPTSSTGAAQ